MSLPPNTLLIPPVRKYHAKTQHIFFQVMFAEIYVECAQVLNDIYLFMYPGYFVDLVLHVCIVQYV